MAVKRCEANIDVVKAAEIRIKNVFGNGLPVFFSFSGGKDSLCVAQLMVNLANRGEIDMKQLTVQFIDEEAIFPCMEDMTKKWRRIFMMMGAKFEWYCVEVKHFNCFNELSNDETFICWDSAKQDVWVRQPPSFAIRNKRQMRVSQFFSVDTARSLVKMNEYYPDLMERIIRREPNAYLAALYWDSEMFGRSSRKRKEAEEGQEQRDYRQELIHLFNHMDVFFDTPHKRHVAERYRNFFMAVSAIATSADCKHIYEGLISGDPKMRAFRALYQRVYGRYINDAKKGEHHGQ